MVSLLALALSAVPAPAAVPAQGVTTRALIEAADISGLAVSPDGRHVAYRVVRGSLADDKMLADWYVAPLDGRSPPRRVGPGGETLFTHAGSVAHETPVWTPDGTMILYRARLEKSVQIWAADLAGRASRLTDDPADVSSFALSPDGRSIVYRTGATRAAIRQASADIYDHGMLVDGTTDLAQPVAGGLVIDGERVMQRYTGKWFERAPLLHETPLREHVIASPRPGRQPARPAGAIRLVKTGDATDLFVDGVGPQPIRCPRTACGEKPAGAVWVPGVPALLVARGDTPGQAALWLWRLDGRPAKQVADQAGTLDGGDQPLPGPCVASAAMAICVAAAVASPPRLVAIDFATGRQHILADPNADLQRSISSRTVSLDWPADGRMFHGELLLPGTATGPVPLVLSYYRCRGFQRGGFGEALPIPPLVDAGIAVLCIESLRSPGAYFAPTDYALGLKGIAAVLDRLAHDGTIAPDKVGMWGFSFGSEVTQWVFRHSKLLKTASLASLQINESYFWPNALPGRNMQQNLKATFGLDWPDRAPEAWASIAPSRNTDTLSVPVLIQSAEDEVRWMGEYLSAALRDGKPVEMHAFADEAHVLMRPRHKKAALERNLDWFRYWLKGDRDPSAWKAAQYARWDRLASMHASEVVDRAHP